MAILNHWNAFNLRQSPFFQDTLRAGVDARYPLDLFVGRRKESELVLRSIFGAPDSRQVIIGASGYGKTTLAQYIKARAADKGFLSNAEPVSVMSTEGADELLVRLLSYAYDTLYSFSKGALADEAAMQSAQQLVLAFRTQSGGGNFSLSVNTPLGGGGIGLGRQQGVTYQQSSFVAPVLVVPKLLTELLQLGRSKIRNFEGFVVHLNNLENLSDADAKATGRTLRDLRDLFLRDGYHYLLVGTPQIEREVIAPHAQLRSVFTIADELEPLTLEEFSEVLGRRYKYLRLSTAKPVQAPVKPKALGDLYKVFAGDLRGILNALDYSANLLLGYTGKGAAPPIDTGSINAVLRQRYYKEAIARLSEPTLEYLEKLSGRANDRITQSDLTKQWKVSQAIVSRTLDELQKFGYAREAGREGRRVIYEWTGPARMILGSDLRHHS